MRALLILTVAAVAAGCASAPKQDLAASGAVQPSDKAATAGCAAPATPIPGGIADPDRQRLYLRVGDGIEAVELATGATVWRTANARWPLAVSEQYLAAARLVEGAEGGLQLSLHEREGGALLSLGPVVAVGGADRLGLQAAFCGEGVIELVWTGAAQGGGVRADLLARTVVGPPADLAASAARLRVGEAKVGELLLRGEGGQLRAYSADGLLRWERPLERERVSAR